MLDKLQRGQKWAHTYGNIVWMMVAISIASVLLSIWTPTGLEKAAFFVAVNVAMGTVGLLMNFAKSAGGSDGMPLPDLNVRIMSVMALVVLGVMIRFVDSTIYTDSVAEGVASGFVTGYIAAASAFFKKSD